MLKLSVLLIGMSILKSTANATCILPPPGSFKSVNAASCQIYLKWDVVISATNYTIQYKPAASGTWITLNNIGNITSFTLTGLASGTTYHIKVVAICSNNEAGIYTNQITATTSLCSKPTGVILDAFTATSAAVSWTAPCGEANFTLKYRKITESVYTTQKNIYTPSYTLVNLEPNTQYQVKVQSKCSGTNLSKFTTPVTFNTTASMAAYSGKNVLLVIVDDARFDSYSTNGGPSFFNDTNISRIADEGVNFELSFPSQSQCSPSRGSIITGVYPHRHGVLNNPNFDESDTITLPTLPEILHNQGYYCGLIGKYHISPWPQPGYDFWMENHMGVYIDGKYNINGIENIISGHQTDVLTDSAMGFFKKVPAGTPFFLWLGYRAPHTPYVSRPRDEGLYDGYTMPYPAYPNKYTINYPGFLYSCKNAPDSARIAENWRGYFELLQGVESDLGKLYHFMDSMGIMDSTLIIFMSDNGYIMGEHHLFQK
ncbi:MAG: sulfatase-like hydrolase/transferase, partial [Chitinophagales bacterium]